MIGKNKIEDYLKEIYLLQSEKGCAKSHEIAKKLDVKRSTVCVALRDLVEFGYVEYSDEKEIILTDRGAMVAVSVLERYQFFLNLVQKLQVCRELAQQDACMLEHSLSEESFQALKRYFQLCRIDLKTENRAVSLIE